MKNGLLLAGLLLASAAFSPCAKADTVITVTNGTGTYASYLAFYDANNTYIVLDGINGVVTLTYPDQTRLTYPYSQSTSGLSITGTWSGSDESGYFYTASVHEYLGQRKTSGSGRGGGYHTGTVTYLANGTISYDYAGAYAPPLVAPVLSYNSTSTGVTLTWTAASGGVAPYTYSVFDENGTDLLDTTGLTATFSELTPSSGYVYTVVTTDAAGRQISASIDAFTQVPTLDTDYVYDPVTNSVTATWNPAPGTVSYSVFYYDWFLGLWIDGADTTGTSATVSGWTPDLYIPFYIAGYDANGVETDYDQQLVYVQAPPPPPPPGGGDDGGGDN